MTDLGSTPTRTPTRGPATESLVTVLVAFGANVLVAVAKSSRRR